MYIPSKLDLASLPTPIRRMDRLSADLGVSVWMKHDEMTGAEYSGNKIRKLDYVLHEALARGCDTLITTGGIQSNHCRATVAAGIRLGLHSVLLLRVRRPEELKMEGNYFLDKVMGADIRFCNGEEYALHRNEIMETMAADLRAQGHKPYIIPEGASNGMGTLGYYNCMCEIAAQEVSLGICFDTVVCATGSGGTAAGLNLANRIHGYGKRVATYCVCDDTAYFQKRISDMGNDCMDIMQMAASERPDFAPTSIEVHDGYVGIGYAISRPEELAFISSLARLEGIVLDPVYTGKAMYGLVSDIRTGIYSAARNILFVHTGGLYGLFPKQEEFGFSCI